MKTLKMLFKQDKEVFVVPKCVQDIIPVNKIWQDGVFQVGKNKFSKCYRFTDINYAVASRADKEAMFLEYSELLNSFDTGATTKITILNRRLNKVDFEKNILLPLAEDNLDEYRKEHEEEDFEQKIEELATAKTVKPRKTPKTGVIVKGIDNCLVKLSKCCSPLPGDDIIGYITKGRGVSVHRTDCVNVKDLLNEPNRMIDVSWFSETKAAYNVDIEIYANDRSGLLADIISTLESIIGVEIEENTLKDISQEDRTRILKISSNELYQKYEINGDVRKMDSWKFVYSNEKYEGSIIGD